MCIYILICSDPKGSAFIFFLILLPTELCCNYGMNSIHSIFIFNFKSLFKKSLRNTALIKVWVHCPGTDIL